MTIFSGVKPVFHLATLFARREAKTSIRHHDWLKLAGEKIRREQAETVPTFLSVRVNEFAKWKTGLTACTILLTRVLWIEISFSSIYYLA